MDEKVRINNFYQLLDQKKDRFHPSDFRFYNIARLPVLAKKTIEYSGRCPVCRKNIRLLEDMAEQLPESLSKKNTRKQFEKNRDHIEAHLKREHKLRYANYYVSLYTLTGTLTGLLTGFLITLFITNSGNIVLILTAFGIISGYLTGKIKDKRKYHRNQQI
ncbi:MAG: hypothetical protein PVF73_05640 [Bacteroidales bacterium]|jgi:F0F1-type ATP synthase assembly protein I